jgi:hypothetical protein
VEPVSFDGVNQLITVKYAGGITSVTAKDMYSAWKRWVQEDNANYLPAFGNSVGGDELGGGVSLTGYFFVRNDLGWRITHEEFNYEIRFSGDLYPTDPDVTLFVTTPSAHSVQFILQRSSATQVVTVDTGNVVPSPQEIRDAMTLAATNAADEGSVDEKLDKVKRDTALIPATL